MPFSESRVYGKHLLTSHREENSMLSTWFHLPGAKKTKAMTLYSIRLGEFGEFKP